VRRPASVLIAGAGLAGARCAETLRAEGYDGRIRLVGEEPFPPYERPALSKEFLAGERSAEDLLLRPSGFWAEQEIELVLGRRVEPSDELLVVATGARPRRLATPGAHLLRTLADAIALRAELRRGRHLAVVGGGFVGAEVASTARRLGLRVTVLEAGPTPFARVLGTDVGDVLARRYCAHGIDLRTNTTGAALAGIAYDIVLVAIGVEPARELVRAGVHVCGDAAGGPGHWTAAAGGGVAAARSILGLEPLPEQPPFFWSDQFGLRLQLVGDPRRASTVELDGSEESFAARYLGADGRLVAALAANRSADVAAFRRELAFAA
jgi:3-phenylpropionate/trans-cinnamate dioxygenase ferredoxin reductase subunit